MAMRNFAKLIIFPLIVDLSPMNRAKCPIIMEGRVLHQGHHPESLMRDRIFAGCFGEGIRYADRHREKNGDYAHLAYLPFGSLELDIYDDCPKDLRGEIVKHAKCIQDRKGQEYRISTAGQTVTLGWQLR